MITSLKVGDKFTVPEEFDFYGANFEPDVVYTVVKALEDEDSYSVEPGRGMLDQWHFSLKKVNGWYSHNTFEPYPAEETSIGDRLKDALEILETAGPLPDFVLDGSPEAFEAVAREYLGKAIRAQEAREAKEVVEKDLEELALKLLNANNDLFASKKFSDWSEVDSSSLKAHWVGVAKEAKEFFSEGNNEG